MTAELWHWLKQHKVHISISWDGPLYIQEKTRPMKGGYKKDHYVETRKEIGDSVKHMGAKAMVSPTNVDSMLDIAKYFYNNGAGFIDLTVVRDDIWDDDSLHLFKEKLEELYYYQKDIIVDGVVIGLFTLPIMDYLIYKEQGTRAYSCFAGTTGIAVNTDGVIYPCERFATNEYMRLGSLDDGFGKTIMERNAITTLYHAKCQNYTVCADCPIRNFCYKGCHYAQLEANYTVRKPVASHCKLYKAMTYYAFKLFQECPSFESIINDRIRRAMNRRDKKDDSRN